VLTLVLTRHGLTPRSDPEQHLGQHIDIGLSEEGREQAAALAARISGERFDRIVASPLVRARETAAAIAGARPIELDPRLMEMDYGRWEGLTYEQIDATDAAYRRRWEADPATLPCPGGESGDDVARRAGSFLEDLLRWSAGAGPDPVVLAVAHSTLNRILVCVALEVPVLEFRRRFTQAQVNISALRYWDGAGVGQARLLVLNDLGHVHAPDQAPWELRPGA
jgi:broad specificity phosphatase PhoE